MSVPGKSHKYIGENQKRNGIKCVHNVKYELKELRGLTEIFILFCTKILQSIQ